MNLLENNLKLISVDIFKDTFPWVNMENIVIRVARLLF